MQYSNEIDSILAEDGFDKRIVLGLEFQTVARINVTLSSSNSALEDFEKRDPLALRLIEELYDEDFSIFGYLRDPQMSGLFSGI